MFHLVNKLHFRNNANLSAGTLLNTLECVANDLSDHCSSDFGMDDTLEMETAVLVSEDFLCHGLSVQLTFRSEEFRAKDWTIADCCPPSGVW